MKIYQKAIGFMAALMLLIVALPQPVKAAGNIHVTYHTNKTLPGHAQPDKTYEADYSVGDKLAGYDVHHVWRQEFPQNEDWHPTIKTVAWNTKPDGTGQWYRGGYKLTAEDPENLELYMIWQEAGELAAAIPELSNVKPQIYLQEETNHTTKETAYEVNRSQALQYRGELDYEAIRNRMVVLWGRVDLVQFSEGKLNAILDRNLSFDSKVKVFFKSTWMVPDTDNLPEGVSQPVPTNGGWVAEVDMAYAENYRNQDGDFVFPIPVKMMDLDQFAELSFEDFMRPMAIEVIADNGKGLNAYITEEAYERVANSNDPYVKASGSIEMKVNASFLGNKMEFPMKAEADPQWAKLTLTPDPTPTPVPTATPVPTVPAVKKLGKPPVNPVNEKSTTVTGTGELGAAVYVTLPNGEVITTTVDKDGMWKVNVPSTVTLKAGDKITAYQTKTGYEPSDKTEVTVSAVVSPTKTPAKEMPKTGESQSMTLVLAMALAAASLIVVRVVKNK